MSNNPFDFPAQPSNPFEASSTNPFADFSAPKPSVTQTQATSDWDTPSPTSPQSPRGSTQRYSIPEQTEPQPKSPSTPVQSSPSLPPQKIADYSFKVVDYEVVNSSYALFLIEVGHYGVILIIKKRFSQLHDFYSSLGIKGLKGPARHLKNSLDDAFLRDRMREIQAFLTELSTVPNITKNPKVIEFFQISDIEEKKQDTFFVQQAALKTTHEELSKVTTERDSLKSEVDQLTTLKENLLEKLDSMEKELMDLNQRYSELRIDRDRIQEDYGRKEKQVEDILSSLRSLLQANESSTSQQASFVRVNPFG